MVVASVVVTNGAVAAMWAVGAVTVKASTMFDLIQPTDANTASIIHLIVIMIPTICCMLETLLSARTEPNRTFEMVLFNDDVFVGMSRIGA